MQSYWLSNQGDKFMHMIGAHDEIMSKVWNHMTSDPVTIEFTATLKDAVDVMTKKRIGNLVVTNGASIGILTEREILNCLDLYGQIPERRLDEMLLTKFTKVSPETSIDVAARLMISTKTRLLVYDENNKMVGIITTSDLARAFFKTTDRNPSLGNVMSRDVVMLDHLASIRDAVRLMDKKRIGSIIVTSNGLHDAIFTERDLLRVLKENIDIEHEIVGDYCPHYLITARFGIRARDAAKLMFANDIKRLPITNNGKIIGIVTARDLIESFISNNRHEEENTSKSCDPIC